MKKIACIGGITTDIIVKPIDAIPPTGTLHAVSSVEMHVGGCASNAAIDLAILGVPVSLLCRLGCDSFGDFVKQTCETHGVDVNGVVFHNGDVTTGSVVCINSSGERSFLYNPGSSANLTLQDINKKAIEESEIIFIGGAFLLTAFDGKPAAELCKNAQAAGKMTVMDTAWDYTGRWLPTIAQTLPHLDLFMPSYDEAVQLTGETDVNSIADKLFELGPKTIVVKIGSDGALVCESKKNRYLLPTYSGVKVVDTTGAGDSFCAGFLAGLSQGWDYKRSGQFANAVGTHCVMAVGASTGMKPISEIIKFMEGYQL